VQEEIPGALYAPHIFDLAVSPADANVVLVSALDSQYADGEMASTAPPMAERTGRW